MKKSVKACPFCGGKARVDAYHPIGDAGIYSVQCDNCHVLTVYGKRQEVIERWNRRAIARRGKGE